MIYTKRAKTIILQFLQDAFSQNDFVDGGNEFLWSRDEEVSKILIADNYTENMAKSDQRPAIILGRGPIAWSNIGLNQQKGQSFRAGTQTFQDKLRTSVVCNCFSRQGIQAETIASIVFSGIQFFADEIRKRGAFEINSVSIAQESIIEIDSRHDLSVVPVEIDLHITDQWVIRKTGETRHDSNKFTLHTPSFDIEQTL